MRGKSSLWRDWPAKSSARRTWKEALYGGYNIIDDESTDCCISILPHHSAKIFCPELRGLHIRGTIAKNLESEALSGQIRPISFFRGQNSRPRT